MAKLDHITIHVRDFRVSRDWYIRSLGLRLEFEVVERRTAARQDDSGLTLFVSEPDDDAVVPSCILYFRVEDVEAKHRQLSAAGAAFTHARAKTPWGYRAELRDPDGYLVRLWDEKSTREKGDG